MHATSADESATLPVATTSGPVVGRHLDGLDVHLGIPYAAPPVGDGRFAPPRPPAPWTEPLAARAYGPSCPQIDDGPLGDLVPGMTVTETDEDCLSLNVWTPGPDGQRPVLVWFHGGGYSLGGSSLELYDGAGLARNHDVVVVSCNYRLGALGYLALDDPSASANCGVLDQIAALTWVGENVAAFGGDPSRVCVFGESAGGGSVLSLLAAPAAEGRFRRAIVSSGASNQFLDPEAARTVARRLLEHTGTDLAGLRALPVDDLLAAAAAVAAASLGEVGLMPFAPTVDGVVQATDWVHAPDHGLGLDVEVLVGTTADEMRLFASFDPGGADLDESGFAARVAAVGGDDSVAAAYRAALPSATPADRWQAVLTDVSMWRPALDVVEHRLAAGASTWMYRFDWPAADSALGACHGIDIPFPFGTVDRAGWDAFLADVEGARALSARVAASWARFAASGDPGWPAYDPTRRTTRVFGATDHDVDDPWSARRRAWSDAAG